MLKLVSTFIYLFSYCGLIKRVASTSLLSSPAFDTQPRHFLFSAICHDCRHALQKRYFRWNFHLIIAHFNFFVSQNDVTIAATSQSFKMGSLFKKVGDHCCRRCSHPAWNLVRPRSWCGKIHFQTKKQAQKWENWSFVHFSVRWNWII